MPLLGLIVGAIIGMLEGGPGLIIGAVVGLMVGNALAKKEPRRVPDDAWKRSVDDLLQTLDRRLQALEQHLHVKPPAAEATPDVAPSVAAAAEAAVPARPPMAAIEREPLRGPPSLHLARPAAADAAPPPPIEPRPPAPAAPPPDSPIVRWLMGGNTLVRVGVIVLFFGVAFLLKFVAERDLVPIELRLAGVALGGIALLAVGWRLRERRAGYALMLQGAGVGVLYMTVFAALRLYHLLPPVLAFGLLVGIAGFAAVLAVSQDSRSLAITGVLGGFLAPVLASTGTGNHVTLFAFYAVLNAGIVAIAARKAWREFNLIGFGFTFATSLAWGSRYYRPELFSTTEPFLILFFLFYVAIAVLFALRQAPRLTDPVDGTIVFGTPIAAFGLQTALVRGMTFGAAWSALALAAFYVSLATVLHARRRPELKLLNEAFLAIGVAFATLAVPLAFDGRWTAAVWAVEGAAILWVGVRQGRLLPRLTGILLQPAAGYALLDTGYPADAASPVLNSWYLGCVMVSLGGLFCSYYLERRAASVGPAELRAGRLLFVWGALWWFAAGTAEIQRHGSGDWETARHLLFFAGSCAAFGWLWRRLGWEMARRAALALLPLMALVLLLSYGDRPEQWHPLVNQTHFAWLFAFGVHLGLMRAHRGRDYASLDAFHAAGFWLLTLVLTLELGWQIERYVEGRGVWPLIAWALVPGTFLALFAIAGPRLGWPVAAHPQAYLYAGALPLAVFLLGWLVYVNFSSNGDPAPLPYAPVLNPLDLAQAGALLAVVTWYIGVRRRGLTGATLPDSTTAIRVLGVAIFVILNGVLLRTLHHYADLPFRLDDLWSSSLVQASFSILWSLLALTAMGLATRRGLRALWMVGAGLLAVVVAKLFLVDLANSGTVERVVSFIGVGLLVIVVGYFSPVPPRAQEQEA